MSDETGLAPTALGEVPETEAHRAWALDPDPPEPSSRRGVVAAAVAAALLLIAGAGGVAVWQLRPVEPVAPVVVAVEPIEPEPPAEPEPVVKPDFSSVPAAKTVNPPPPPAPVSLVDYDQRFLSRMQAAGFVIWNPSLAVTRAHQVCALLRAGETVAQVRQRMAVEASKDGSDPYPTADTIMAAVMDIYPNCP